MLRKHFSDLLLAVALVVSVDVVLFHGGLYFQVLQPSSYSGRIESMSRRFHATLEAFPEHPRIVIMGDSTAGSCVDEKELSQFLAARGLDFFGINLSQGGSTSRSWYHLIANEEIYSSNTRAVVLGIHPVALMEFDILKPDIDIVKTRVSLDDVVTLAQGYEGLETRLEVLSGVFYRLPWFRDDVRELLRNPPKRLRIVRRHLEDEARFRRGWRRQVLSDRTLLSARLGPDGKLVKEGLAPFIAEDPKLQQDLVRMLARRGAKRGKPFQLDPLKKDQLRRLVRLLDSRGITTVVAVTPDNAFSLAGREVEDLQKTFDGLKAEGLDVAFFHDTEMLNKVEDPAYFRDQLHVNAAGATLYTQALAEFLAPMLRTSDP